MTQLEFDFKNPPITKDLAEYIASYIQEELYRGVAIYDIDGYMVLNAIDAYEGGAER